MTSCMNCNPFITTIITDYATGDTICTECGLVVERDFALTYDCFHNAAHMSSSSPSLTTTTSSSTRAKVEMILHAYKLSTHILTIILEWVERIQLDDSSGLKMLCCAFHLTENNMTTFTEIHTMSKKMHVNYNEVCLEIEKILKRTCCARVVDTPTSEWIRALHIQMVTLCSATVCSSKEIAQLKLRASDLVHVKPECMFHNLEMIAVVIILEANIPIEHTFDKRKLRKVRNELFQ